MLPLWQSPSPHAGGGTEPTPEVTPSSQQEQQIDTSTPDVTEPTDDPVTSTADPLPDGVDLPVDQYPWTAGLVLPDGAVITSIQDEYYETDGNIKLVVEPMDEAKTAAYLEKLENSGFTKDVGGWINPDVQFDLNVMDWSSMGYVTLSLWEK